MSFSWFYYHFKPIIPWSVRIALRRWRAQRILQSDMSQWPIKDGSQVPPANWSGWPEGKQFAFVLTHDVEGPEGLERCHALMDVEKKHGFRSSFNFIPEGDYPVPTELLREMVEEGFEVGVHDLKHDGKLYRSPKRFQSRAKKINRYLEDWGAVGFRSGFMHHNLNWIHDLNILYDASTFDTDPFEPQPDGVDTIFPFWVRGRNGKGYVELPYTAVQDFNLFVILQEKTTDIWKQKVDWIAAHRGMALLNAHPDYITPKDHAFSKRRYPLELFDEFLGYFKQRYAGKYWHVLPREMAAHDRDHKDQFQHPQSHPEWSRTSSVSGKRAAAVVFSHYPSDPRPRRAAESLAAEGMSVEVLCLKKTAEEPAQETVNGVHVTRINVKKRRGGKLNYALQYGSFLGICLTRVTWRHLRKKFDLVHVHNMPDVLVFSALLPKVTGAKVVLDLHDPMPELMVTIFNLGPDSLSVRILKALEKWSIGFADLVLTVNLASKRIFCSRGCAEQKIEVIMNSPDERIFALQAPPSASPVPVRRAGAPFVLMYHGSMVARNGLDVAVEAMNRIRDSIPQAELRIYGERTAFLEEVLETVNQLNLQNRVQFFGPQSLEGIVAAIDQCDLGLIPNRRNPFAEMNTPTRIFEYLSRGKLVIAPRTQGILDYFGDGELLYFELGDGQDLARQIESVYRHPAKAEKILFHGQSVYRTHRWAHERERFVGVLSDLVEPAAAQAS